MRRVPQTSTPARLPALVRYGVPALLVGLVLLCFHPVLQNGFVAFDDDAGLTENPYYRGLSPSHLAWMFTTFHLGHYQPLSWLTHALVYEIWGMDPTGYHLGNLLLHAANAVLAYVLIATLLSLWFPPPVANPQWLRVAAAIGALFFALHPLRVEPVAWATERRELLCGFFLLLTVWAYLRMQSAAGASARRGWMLLSVAVYASSLLSKAMGLTLPVVLLALDVYPLRRWTAANRSRVLVEKVPYVLLAGSAAALAVLGVHHEGMVPFSKYSVAERCAQAAYGLCFYLWKTIVPSGLSPLYQLERPLDPSRARYIVSILGVLFITSAAIAVRRRYPWALLAWICYVVIVSPVLGLLQSGPQIAADRYTYLACLPWAAVVAAGAYELCRQRARGSRRMEASAGFAGMCIVLAALGVCSYNQTHVWKDSLTLWNRVLQIEPYNSFAHNNRGTRLQAGGDLDGALTDFSAAITTSPEYTKAYNNRAVVRRAKGDIAGARTDLDRAIELDPQYTDAYVNRGGVREVQGDLNGARADYDRALQLDPGHAVAYHNRANIERALGQQDAAFNDYSAALRLRPDLADAYSGRGSVREVGGDVAGALADYETALRLNPQDARARAGRGRVHQARGETTEALADFNAALQLNPKDAGTYNNRGVIREAQGDVAGAISDFTQALALTPPAAPYRATVDANLARVRQTQSEGHD